MDFGQKAKTEQEQCDLSYCLHLCCLKAILVLSVMAQTLCLFPYMYRAQTAASILAARVHFKVCILLMITTVDVTVGICGVHVNWKPVACQSVG